ncbi:MAG: hypothetical protein ACHQIM_02595 [Sphingobacteriales bacterium]
MKRFSLTYLLVILLPLWSLSQVSILSTSVNSFNITPGSLCQVNVMNTFGDVQAVLEADIFGADNTSLLKVTTNTFILKKGLNSLGMNISIGSAQYGNNEVSTHIKTFHTLPSGKYHACWTIKLFSHDASGDQLCEDVESENTAFLFLVFPADHDTIDSPMPLLSWSHSDPFNIGSTGDFYRMVVVKLNPGQSAESGVMTNTPVFMKNSLLRHEVQYPYDAPSLVVGERYGWQVQKISNEVIVNKTEAWDFVLRPPLSSNDNKYAMLKTKLDAGYYLSKNEKIYFRFEERYQAGAGLSSVIYDPKMKILRPNAKNEKSPGQEQYNIKTHGDNQYEIDLSQFKLKKGYYFLEVKNEKKETFMLKFYVE